MKSKANGLQTDESYVLKRKTNKTIVSAMKTRYFGNAGCDS